MKWNFCLTCLCQLPTSVTDKGGEGHVVAVNKKRINSSIKFLLNYLLTTRAKTYDGVLNDVLKLIGLGTCDTETKDEVHDEGNSKSARLCGKCEGTAERVLDLHLKLKKLQRKIREEVKSVNEAILKGSGWLGGISGGSEAFENFSKKFCLEEAGSLEAKLTFDILKAFQTAVNEADYERNPQHSQSSCVDEPTNNELSSPNIKEECVTDFMKTEEETEEDEISVQWSLPNFLDDFVSSYPLDFEEHIFSEAEVNTTKSAATAVSAKSSVTDGFIVKADGERLPPPPPPFYGRSSNPKNNSRFKRPYYLGSPSPSNLLGRKKRKIKKGTGLIRINNSQPKSSTNVISPQKREKKGTTGYPPPSLRKIGRKFICESCSFKTKYTSVIEQHLRGHESEAQEKSLHCEQCGQGFSNAQNYHLHLDQHKGYHKIFCEVCKDFYPAFELPEHMKTHVETIFPCLHCSHCSSSIKTHLFHLRFSHLGKDIKCWICGELFQKKLHLLEHLHEAHQVIDKIGCDVEGCTKTFLTEDALNRHQNGHKDEFICKICCRRMSSLASLKTHQRLHTNEKPFECDKCPEAFNLKGALVNHMVRKHGAEKFKCETCGREYTSTEGLHQHRRLEHSDKAKYCTICPKKCATDYKLKLHMQSHSTEISYVCDVCGKSFLTKDRSDKHKRKVHGEKKYQCSHCPKAFTDMEYLHMHVRTHTGEKPYPCEFCGKGFSQRSSRTIHQKKCQLSNRTESEPQPSLTNL